MSQITPETALKLLEALRVLVLQRDGHFHTTAAWSEARAAIALAEQEMETDR